jgi:hypothetical protein
MSKDPEQSEEPGASGIDLAMTHGMLRPLDLAEERLFVDPYRW